MAGKSLNRVQILGRLGKDPELRYTTNGKAVATFDVASGGDKWTDAQGQAHEEKTEWHRCVAWERVGEIAGEYLAKGKQVYLEGKLQTRSWEDDKGVKRYTTEILVKDLILLGDRGDSAGSRPPHPADTYAPQASSPAAAPTHTGKVSESPAMPPIQEMPPDDIPF